MKKKNLYGLKSSKFDLCLINKFKIYTQSAGILVAVIGISGLLGWIFNVSFLKSIAPGFVFMKPVASVSFLLAGISLSFSNYNRSNNLIKKIPVVILTFSNEEKNAMESCRLCVNVYNGKPADFKEFIHAVKQPGFFWAIINQPPTSTHYK